MSIQPEMADEDPGLQRALEILETSDESVVEGLFKLLSVTTKPTNWAPKHTSNTLQIFSDHLDKCAELKRLEIESNERLIARKQIPILIVLTFVGVLLLSWMFLHYGKPEFIVAVITGNAGFVAGHGYGKANAEKKAS